MKLREITCEIKVKKCMGVGYVAECVEESRERKRMKTKGEGLALVAEEKRKEKRKRKRKGKWVGLGWVRCGDVPINILKE